jgi:pyruvate dehydrogenase E2 component (dihydrolipoamide acetyltransferase)
MAVEVIVPEVGEVGMDVTFVRWLRDEGDEVREGDPLFEVDTLKAVMEVQAYASGRLAAVTAREGDIVQPHQVLAVLLEPSEAVASPIAQPVRTAATDANTGPAANATPAPITTPAIPEAAGVAGAATTTRSPVSPRARRIASEIGLDIDSVAGTGPDGFITERDVRDAAAARPASHVSLVTDDAARVERIRAGVAERTTRAWQTIPHYYLGLEVDVTAAFERGRITAVLCLAAARALARHPECNLTWAGDKLERHASVDLGLLVDTPLGLLIARIPDGDKLNLAQMTESVATAAARARVGKLEAFDAGPRSLTISNLGMHAVDSFAGVIAVPDVMLLTSGRAHMAPRWDGAAFQPRRVLDLTLSVDHRALDGAAGGRYLSTLESTLAEPGEFD